ncbi:hypothetical protein C6H64_14930 [Photorhabdus luminescens]|nr:hypothetical protein C6H64_14930 [Photorhabdus luminescens]
MFLIDELAISLLLSYNVLLIVVILFSTKESWNHGIMESWNHGIMESWNHGINGDSMNNGRHGEKRFSNYCNLNSRYIVTI